MVARREKFSSQAAPELLAAVREIAPGMAGISKQCWKMPCVNTFKTGKAPKATLKRRSALKSWPIFAPA